MADKKIIRHMGYELKYAEQKHPLQDKSLNDWLFIIKDKVERCIEETNNKEKASRSTYLSGCGFSGEEERFCVLFACMAIAQRGILNHYNNSYFIRRLKYFKSHGINIETVDEIELKIAELEELKRQKEIEECED